jgi:hypothetical protein
VVESLRQVAEGVVAAAPHGLDDSGGGGGRRLRITLRGTGERGVSRGLGQGIPV